MITASFIWLILSHSAVFFPIIIGLKINKRRWLACSIVLFLTSLFSSIYHWHEGATVNIPSTDYNTHKSLDFFCSYLSIFLVVFYSINPRERPEHIDISLMIIVIISHILTLISTAWYTFFLIVLLYCFIYKLFCKNTPWINTFYNIINNFNYFFLGLLTFVFGMIMQYYFCYHYSSGYYYHIYHGLWHAFMFTSAGMWIKWNETIRKEKNNTIINLSDNIETENVTEIIVI